MKEKTCHVIGAGDLAVSKVERSPGDLVIAVDGGFSYCPLLGLEPDFILGDFDSVGERELEVIRHMEKEEPERILRLNPQKDDTDLLAALKFGLARGYRSFRIYGGTGGRLEHTIANIQCLLFLKGQGAAGCLCDGETLIFVLKDEEVRFRPGTKGLLSLFCLGKEARGVTIRGMKYPLDGYTMKNDFPIGISNEFIGKEAVVSVEDGELAAILRLG